MKITKLGKTITASNHIADISYTGVVPLDSISSEGKVIPSNKLLDLFEIPDGWNIVANHMTINVGSAKEETKSIVGNKVNLYIVAISKNDNVMAVMVSSDLETTSKFPHITLAINPLNGATAVMSNELDIWDKVGPYSIVGIVAEVKLDGHIMSDEDRRIKEEERSMIEEERKIREKEKSENSPTNIIKRRNLNRIEAIEFLMNETKIPEKAWQNILDSAGI